jgi:hypothetical protein
VENKHRSGRGQSGLSRIVKKDRRESLSDITKEYNRSVPKQFQSGQFNVSYIGNSTGGGL